jgi:hypothetical protein
LNTETIGNTLYFYSNCDEKIKSIEIYDGLGRTTLKSNNTYFNLNELNAGLNLIHIETDLHAYTIKKMVE